jgi:hypothetical protein
MPRTCKFQSPARTRPDPRLPRQRTGVPSGWVLALAAVTLSSPFTAGALANDQVPAGFSASRYAHLWERNPFTLVTPATPQPTASVFDKLALVSWFQAGKEAVVFVQNTDSNEVQKITTNPNGQGLRLVEVRPNPNPQAVEAVIADNARQGTVRFRLDVQPPGVAVPGAPPGVAGQPGPPGVPGRDQGTAGVQMQPGVPQPGAGRNFPGYNAGTVTNQALNGAPPGQGAANPGGYPRVPTATDYRRRRVVPTPGYSPPQVDPNNARAQ